MRFRVAAALIAFVVLCPRADAAVVYMDPPEGAYGPGDTFMTNIRIDPQGECVNAVSVELAYPPSVRAEDVGRGSSILSLWVEEPVIDANKRTVHFSGGIPGGYCGRVSGDPALTNLLAKVVFTVGKTDAKDAAIVFAPATRAYLNDGRGTSAKLTMQGVSVVLSASSTGVSNPWLAEVGLDTIPPDPFSISIESTRDVYGGNYYLVFSTIDKQSGLDHYEMFDRGAWAQVSSPHEIKGPLFRDELQIRAVDKAGNVRLGVLASSTPERQGSPIGPIALVLLSIVALVSGALLWYRERRKSVV